MTAFGRMASCLRVHNVVRDIMSVRVGMKRGFCEGNHERLIRMPTVMNAKNGTVDKWLKKEGEYFESLESLCEVTLSVEEIRIGVDVERCGVLCSILVAAGQTVDVNEPIAMFVDDMDDYMEHVEKQKELLKEEKEEKEKKTDAGPVSHSKNLLRHIKMMIQSDEIDSNSDFAKELQSLARKGNEDLISVFEASYESENFTPESFDKKFFLSNAEEIVTESLKSKKPSS